MAAGPTTACLLPLAFTDLPGWAVMDCRLAFAALRRAAPLVFGDRPTAFALAPPFAAIAAAAALPADLRLEAARAFFERHFTLRRIALPGDARGFVTGYFEPEVAASPVPTEGLRFPLHRPPQGLGSIAAPDRAAVYAGALDGAGLELCYVASAIEAYFIQVQGSARLRLPGGSVRRIGFAGKSGHPYTSIGGLAIARGLIPAAEMTAGRLRAVLEAMGEAAKDLLAGNRSYVYFDWRPECDDEPGPRGAAGLPLIAGCSLAVDPRFIPFATPVIVTAELPSPTGPLARFDRLMLAEDTGSAIVGPARGDIFFGSGEDAGAHASLIRHAADFTLLVARDAGPDRDEFGLVQSKFINAIDSNRLERDAGGKPVSTFPHPAPGEKV